MKVLLVGHACCPGVGSEPGLTWNWAWHLAAHHEVWLLAHPGYRAEVERYLRERPNPRLHVVWVSLPARWDPYDPVRGERGLRLHYVLWQHAAYRVAAQLHEQERFDIAHYVSWNTVSVPPLLWRLGVPFVWGPVGGGMATPPAFLRYFGRSRHHEALRSLRVRLLPLMPPLRRAARHAALLLATNWETVQVLEAAGARGVRPMVDNGLVPGGVPDGPHRRPNRADLTLLWAGRLEPRKALPLALDALAGAADVPARLLVAGDGPDRAALERAVGRSGLASRVEFLGQVPRLRMAELFREADAFLFTSLRDSSGSVVIEAMAHALPILTLDHQGVGFFVPPEAGIKVPVTRPEETTAGLADGLRRLATSPEEMTRWYGEVLSARGGDPTPVDRAPLAAAR
jgi:glycosyltransferase involved in cell wall biosynthesis